MPKHPSSTPPDPLDAAPNVASGDGVALPPRIPGPAAPAEVGVQGVRRSERATGDGRRRMLPSRAGEESSLFPRGGDAFARWAADRGVDPRRRVTAEQVAELLVEFAARPIHGHRRVAGGNHRPNKGSLR